MTPSPFAARVQDGLRRSGITLRGLCRAAGLDPSFFSKVLSGKRSPPEGDVLRRIAAVLDLDATELIVSAGRIPEEWGALRADSDLFRRMDALATSRSRGPGEPANRSRSRGRSAASGAETVEAEAGADTPAFAQRVDLAEELL